MPLDLDVYMYMLGNVKSISMFVNLESAYTSIHVTHSTNLTT